VPEVELEYRRRKRNEESQALTASTSGTEDLETEDSQSQGPFCGEWSRADPSSVRQAVLKARKG
jgi:hypothetical protein